MSRFNVGNKDIQASTAWQYQRRLESAATEANHPYWNNLDLTLKNTIIKEISITEARPIIEKYEWLGTIAAVNKHAYGIYFKDNTTGLSVCGGVVVFGSEYSENLGVWDKYGFSNKIILLNRGVCLHWTPKNTASYLIMAAIKMLPKQYEIVTCTVDHNAGEVGTIYQSCNFHYVGSMGKPDRLRFAVEINGKIYGSRAMRVKVGSQKKADILAKYPDAKFIKQKSKHRYFYFNCDRRKKREYLSRIEHMIIPYKKRESKDSPQR